MTSPQSRATAGSEREKTAPVQGWPAGIPWSLHLEAYAAYCKKWRPQAALIEGGCRGGFSVGELDEFIPGWREKVSEIGRLRAEIEILQTELDRLRASQPSGAAGEYPPLPDMIDLGDNGASNYGYSEDCMRAYVDADRKARQLAACNFCLEQAANARASLASPSSGGWMPIESAPVGAVLFVAKAFDAPNGVGGVYTTDPYCVWQESKGQFIRWPHGAMAPTHWMPIPPAPKSGDKSHE